MFLNIWSIILLQQFGAAEYLVCELNNGTSCPNAVCPHTALNFICNIKAQQLGHTTWQLPNGTCVEKAYNERITLLQPKYGGCNPSSSSQHGTCGPFTAQNIANSGCVNSSLSVVATQELNGTRIGCMNYNGSSLFPIGSATILVVGAPRTPNMSVVPNCTQIKVQWYMSFTSWAQDESITVIVSVTKGHKIIQTHSTSTAESPSSLTFYNLVSDSLYTITIKASNCVGKSNVTMDVWTLPSPPQNVHSKHMVSSPNAVHLHVTWTPVVGINLAYVIKVSFKDDLILNQVPVSSYYCAITTCYFPIDFYATNTSLYFISIATVSDSRMGPFSDTVQSVDEQNSNTLSTYLWFCLSLVVPLLLSFIISCCVCFGKHRKMKPTAAASHGSEPNTYSIVGVQTTLSSTFLRTEDRRLGTCKEVGNCSTKDTKEVADVPAKALYNSLYNAPKEPSFECATDEPTFQYAYVRTKNIKVVTLPLSLNGYSTVSANDGSNQSVEASSPAGLLDDNDKPDVVLPS